jgi:hypothetical protein
LEDATVTSTWAFATDFGTSYTAAAVFTQARAEVLEVDGQRRTPSVVALDVDGTIVVGEHAENRAVLEPDRVERTPKDYLEVGAPDIILGGQALKATAVVGQVLATMYQEALRQHSGQPPEKACVTHPASWGPNRQSLLREAATLAGIPSPELISEPEAAALYLSSTGTPVRDGGIVAVYDLGGGTFDTAVLRRSGERFELLGVPGGKDALGGERFDDHLYRWLGEHALPPETWEALQHAPDKTWRGANSLFRREVRRAKEAISKSAAHPIYLPAPVGQDVQVTREDFERLIKDDIVQTLDLLQETLDRAGVSAGDLSALFLVGGSSRIPLVARMVEERFGRADTKGDPKAVVALGAAQRLGSQLAPPSDPESGQPQPPKDEPPPVSPPKPSRNPKVLIAAVIAALVIGAGVAAAVSGGGGGDDFDGSSNGGTTPTFEETDTPEPTDTTDTTETTDPTEAIVGSWSGAGEDQNGDDVEVEVTIDSAGAGDGSVTESGLDYECGGSLDFDSADDEQVFFTYNEEQNEECLTGQTIVLTYDETDDTVHFLDQAEDSDGNSAEVSATLDRE